MTSPDPDLFGNREGAMTDAERKRMRRRASEQPRGHAMPPGSGPTSETCGSCRHLVRREWGKVYLKCGLTRAAWTRAARTDVRARDAACSKWAALAAVKEV